MTMMSPVHPHPAGRFKSYYRTALAALASRTIKGSVLLLAVALVASGTGAVVLFIDMPLIVMAALSAISLVALVIFATAVRARFFPPTLPVAAVSTSTNISPEKVPGGKTGLSLPGQRTVISRHTFLPCRCRWETEPAGAMR